MTSSLRLRDQKWHRAPTAAVRVLRYGADPWYDDRELLAGLITDEHYADHHDDEVAQRHGPYAMSAIDVSSFAALTREMAHGLLLSWTEEHAELSGPLGRLILTLSDVEELYHLPGLRNRVRHSAGEVPDGLQFDELVLIDRRSGQLVLVVLTAGPIASDIEPLD